jgi:hypothetical protein
MFPETINTPRMLMGYGHMLHGFLRGDLFGDTRGLRTLQSVFLHFSSVVRFGRWDYLRNISDRFSFEILIQNKVGIPGKIIWNLTRSGQSQLKGVVRLYQSRLLPFSTTMFGPTFYVEYKPFVPFKT